MVRTDNNTDLQSNKWANEYLPNIKVLSEEQCDKLLEDYKLFLVSNVIVVMDNELIQ